jgi:ribonuclease BN (tRNA processing enzyme)
VIVTKELYATGISLFEEIGSSSFSEILKVHELILPKTGVVKVTEDEIVHATHVYHRPEVHHAYAYRFDLKSSGKSIVFSGDTTPNQNLVELAHDVDLLVHEAQMNRNIPIALSQVDPSERAALRKHLLDAHTNVTDVPRIAKQAGAKRVAMCHYSLDFRAGAFENAAKRSAAQVNYRGEVLAPDDLDVLYV